MGEELRELKRLHESHAMGAEPYLPVPAPEAITPSTRGSDL